MKREVQEIAAAPVRVSNESQRLQLMIGSQLKAVVANTRERDWIIAPGLIFTGSGYSGTSLDRPDLDAFHDLVAQGALSCALALSPGRLSRTLAYQVALP